MRYRIYSEWEQRPSVEYRETAQAAILRAEYLIERGAAGVEIWDEQNADRVYLPWQFYELLQATGLSTRAVSR